MQYWSLQPILSYPLILLLAGGMLWLALLRPSFGRLTRGRRWTLIGLRAAVIALVVLAMLRPTLVSSTTKRQTAVLLMLLDQSRSMQLPDAQAGRTRWTAQVETMARCQDVLRQLARQFEVRVYGYDQSLHSIELNDGQLALPATPAGQQTDIGSNLFEAVRRELGNRLAGVVLLGDGTQTAYDPKVEIREAGRELARLDYPLYAVMFGPTGDVNQARDVALENLQDQYTVFVKNELPLRAAVRIAGYVNQQIPVTLTIEDEQGNKNMLEPVKVMARQDGIQVPVEMTYVPQEPGRYKLTMRVAQQPGELITQNNHLTAFLNVLEGGIKVLYLYGSHLGEQAKLRESINASPDIEMEHVFIDPRTSDQWPVNLDNVLAKPKFDVLLIEDVDSRALGTNNLAAIAAAVEKGAGLMMIGGFHSFEGGGYQETVLADVLPIELDRTARRQELGYDQTVRRELHEWGQLQMLPSVASHPITRLAPDEQNRQMWQQLPPLIGANKFSKIKPRGQVLAETEDGVELLVAGEYGAGRVLALAANSTVRWWRYGHELEHKRFWRQVVLWLVHRDAVEQHDVWVKLDQRRFHTGSRVVFTAGAKTPQGDVVHDAEFQVRITGPRGAKVQAAVSQDQDQIVGAAEQVQEVGDYRIDITALLDGKPLGTAQAEFVVFDQDIELSNPAPDHLQLGRLANMTRAAGGRAVAPEQLPELLEQIRQQPPEMEFEVPTKWQPGDTAADAWLGFLLIVGLLSGEWILRKRWGLV